MHHSNPSSWNRLIPAGIRQFQLPAPSGMASPCPQLHLSLGIPYLMTNQGKDQSRTHPYWPNREQLWGPLTSPELEGEGGVGSDFKLITIQSPLPNPASTPSLSTASVSGEANLWQCSKLIYLKLPNNLKNVKMFEFHSLISSFLSYLLQMATYNFIRL